ncbi:hypothetical protein SARC_06895 [Sphaeroforma arctica JP610]|uniref:oligopeptidase A n=1 Tax=Sphaeroforma arctica JP610 TaxID=667725 RepID=A0A0L0FW13_9EUKA|nr:hypothetical protein SARC_06895 [Sphaeroforma arctica JP610]KNC80751.1 hypothetical protein SARC_06895 [Sphaeroforma arctica JP610]|eukprot:XP_014154653.1 hypothetical protein SARC_06895 [Sphaeroforma arctica JP610]
MLASTCRKATSRFVLFTKYRSYTNAHTNVSVLSENPLVNLNDEFVKYARVKGEHVVPAVRWALDDFNTRINELETHINKNIEQGNPLTWEEVMDKREVAGTAIERVWGAVNHLKGVRDDSALRKAYDEVQGEVVSTFAAYGQSETLFKAYESIANQGGGAATLTNTQRRVIDQAIRDATHAGVALQGEAREKYKSINMELSNLTTQFSQNVVDSTNAFSLLITDSKQVEGVPANLRLSMATAALKKNSSVADDARVGDADKGPWLLTLDATVFGPFMQTGTCAETREVLYKAYQHRASEFDAAKTEGQNYDNAPIIKRILELRQEKAQMLGYDTYTDMSLAKKMAQNVTNVNDLLEPLFAASRPAAVKELAQLKEFAQQNGHNGDLQLWDVSYWAEKQKLALFGLTDEDLRPYFALPNVLDGMFDLANEIFSISISEAEMPEDVAWDKHVRLFEVKENREGSAKGTTIAKFFMDAFSRPGVKRGGAWMDTCVGKSKAQHHDVPVAFLVCNQTTPAQEGQPSLMTFREVETLFHEFGHSLQHMLTTVDCGDAAGINGMTTARK